MNSTERKMRDILIKGREKYGWLSVKAEFEAEGTRMDELLRLVEIAHSADMGLAVKIGGCEALRDLFEAKQIGVNYIIAPMVETPFALSKYIAAKNKAYSVDEAIDTQFLFNVETITGYENREAMVELARRPGAAGVAGIVFGRSDFAGSLGLDSDGINDPRVTEHVLGIAELCADNGLDLVVGGGVSVDSIPALREIAKVKLTRFETRKVIFSADALGVAQVEDGFLEAIQFELLWLTNKRDYYSALQREDHKRVSALEGRWGGLLPPSLRE
ncbi:MAG: aldolase/citrate lyase family protein [Mycobacteriales bacterium]|nr:aldolase/citrate lyase family protein [Mycobacteriales bacterium]